MRDSSAAEKRIDGGRGREAGFSLAELLVATLILMIISAVTTQALLQMTTSQQTIWNRTQMHAGVRSATELLQQEVGQAGRVALPGGVTLLAAVNAGDPQATVSTTAGIFVGELLVVGAGGESETVKVLTVDEATDTITVDSQTGSTGFFFSHPGPDTPVSVYGGFASGIVPPTMANGSTGTVLKLYGDINSDGQMLYIEYTCDTVGGKLYRNSMLWDTDPASKPAVTESLVLLPNIRPNPGGAPCFSYPDPLPVVGEHTFVNNVAMTLTVETQQVDPITKQRQTEVQTLLSVSPRNVVRVWELAKLDATSRIQPMPPTISALLAP